MISLYLRLNERGVEIGSEPKFHRNFVEKSVPLHYVGYKRSRNVCKFVLGMYFTDSESRYPQFNLKMLENDQNPLRLIKFLWFPIISETECEGGRDQIWANISSQFRWKTSPALRCWLLTVLYRNGCKLVTMMYFKDSESRYLQFHLQMLENDQTPLGLVKFPWFSCIWPILGGGRNQDLSQNFINILLENQSRFTMLVANGPEMFVNPS